MTGRSENRLRQSATGRRYHNVEMSARPNPNPNRTAPTTSTTASVGLLTLFGGGTTHRGHTNVVVLLVFACKGGGTSRSQRALRGRTSQRRGLRSGDTNRRRDQSR